MFRNRKAFDLGAIALAAVLAGGIISSAMAQDKPAAGRENQFGESDSGGSGGGEASGGGGGEPAGGLITANSFDEILASLSRNGFTGELSKDSEGDPRIKSIDEDEPFTIHFYSCTDGKDCQFIQFTSGWNMKNGITLAKIEEWNSNKVWGQAYRDEDKDPWLAMAVNLKGGVSVENFDDTVDWWRVILGEFEKHIEWEKD